MFVMVGIVVLQILHQLLSIITFIIPSEFQNGLNYLFSSVMMFNGIFPVQDLLTAFVTFITVWTLKYTVKLILLGISLLPGVGHKELPGMRDVPEKNILNLRKGNSINLAKGRRTSGRSNKIYRDI